MNTYKCPESDCEGVLEEGVSPEQLTCSDCSHQITEEVATYLFDNGMLVVEMEDEIEVEEVAVSESISPALELLSSPEAYKEIQESIKDLDLKAIYEKHISVDSNGIDFNTMTERFNEMIEEKQVSEELDTILESADFDSDFKDKAKTLFESAISLKVKEEIERLHDINEAFVNEAVAEKSEALELKVDEYLSYVAEEYLKENELAIEAGIKIEAAEKILEGVSSLMKENHIHIDESKVDAYESLEDRFTIQEGELDARIEESIALTKEVKTLKREIVLDTVSEGLSEIQKEKLVTLTEDIDFKEDADFIEKVKVIKESFFDKKVEKIEEVVSESVIQEAVVINAHTDFISSVVANLNKKD